MKHLLCAREGRACALSPQRWKWKESKSERLRCARMLLKPVRDFLRPMVYIQEQGLTSRRFYMPQSGGGGGILLKDRE